jgi:STE24 endopeptidase
MPRTVAILLLLCVSLVYGQRIPPAAQAGPGFNAEAAARAYLDTVSPAHKAQSDAYFEGGYWLILWDFLWGAGVVLIVLQTGLSRRMRDLAERVGVRKPLLTWIYWAQLSVVLFVLGLPLTIYEGFFREKRYGLMNQTFLSWFGDQGKSLGLSIVLGGLVVVALLGIVRRLPRTWHIWGAVVAIVFQMLGGLIYPVFIAPLFNTYTVLADARIRDPILRVARQNEIPATKVYEVDASRQSKRISANVSGFLGTERITLNDNLLNRCSAECVVAVMGHEMGHYVMNHIYKMLAFVTIVYVLFFVALRRSLDWSLGRWGERWGIRGVGDAAVVPLAILILSVLGFVYTPINNTLTRVQEIEADSFGLNTAREPDGFAEAALLLGEYRKLEPGSWEEALLFDHPSGHTRIYAAMRWKAENQCVAGTVNACPMGAGR